MFRDIAAIYRASKKKKDINWWTEYVCRPPAAVFVYFLKDTRVTPNQVTFSSLVVCAASCAMLLFLHGYYWVVAAMVVYELSFVLDCVDGQLARVRKTSSTVGHLLDFLIDEIKAMLLYGCVGVYMWQQTGDLRLLLVALGGMFCLASGIALTSFMRRPEYLAALQSKSADQAKDGTETDGTETEEPASQSSGGRRGLVGSVIGLLEWVARFIVHYPGYILIVAAFGRLDLFFWAYTGVNVLYLGRSMLTILWRLGRFQAKQAS